MRRQPYRWADYLVLAAALTALLFTGRVSAQAPTGGMATPAPAAGHADEIAPRLLSGPDGTVFRLWQRWNDFRVGGGGVFLAEPASGDSWRTLLEILPTEPGVNALDPDVAFGSLKEIAVVYQWRRHAPRTKQVRLARSDDGGKTWVQSSMPIDNSGKGFTPKAAWGKGRNLVVTWMDERRADKAWDIYARRSTDGGSSW